jgi:hypothetical protein
VLFFSGIDGGPSVVRNYYAEGVAWDSVASSRGYVARMGWNVELETPSTTSGPTPWPVRYVIQDSTGVVPAGLDLELRVFRPDRAEPVARAVLLPQADSSWTAGISPPTPGLWDFELGGVAEGRPFTHRVRRELY